MVAKPALEAKLNAIEDELRRIAEIVVPRDERVANDDLALAQDPVSHTRVVDGPVRIDLDARDMERSRHGRGAPRAAAGR